MDAKRDQNRFAVFKVHIEQGPEKRGLPVGVVTAIAGARRFDFVVEGKEYTRAPCHTMRNDALPVLVLVFKRLRKRLRFDESPVKSASGRNASPAMTLFARYKKCKGFGA